MHIRGATLNMQVVPSSAILNATRPKTTLNILTLPLNSIIKIKLLYITEKSLKNPLEFDF